MKKAFFLYFLVLLIGLAGAITINVAGSIPESVSWSFSAEFGSLGSFDKAAIFIDGEKIVTVYSIGSELVVAENRINKRFVSSASADGSSVYLSCLGLGAGSRAINVKTYDDGELVDEIITDVEFYNIIDKINTTDLKSRVDELAFTVNNMQSDDRFFFEGLKERQADINQLRESLSDISSSIDLLKQQLGSSQGDFTAVQQSLQELEQEVAAVEEQLGEAAALQGEEKPEQPSQTGFINLADVLWLPVALAIIILSVIVAFFIKRKLEEKGSIYSIKDEFGLPKEEPKEESAGEEEQEKPKEEVKEEKPGKWSFK